MMEKGIFLLLPTSSGWHKVTAAFYPLCTRDSSSEWRRQIVLRLRKHISFPPHPLFTVFAQGHFSALLILLALWHVVLNVVSR
jgi:hypothetical protein